MEWLGFPLGKEGQTGRVPVQEVAVSNGPYLTLCKKARDGNGSQTFPRRGRVMVRPPKKSLTTAAAAEQEAAERRIPMPGSVGRQEKVQIVSG